MARYLAGLEQALKCLHCRQIATRSEIALTEWVESREECFFAGQVKLHF